MSRVISLAHRAGIASHLLHHHLIIVIALIISLSSHLGIFLSSSSLLIARHQLVHLARVTLIINISLARINARHRSACRVSCASLIILTSLISRAHSLPLFSSSLPSLPHNASRHRARSRIAHRSRLARYHLSRSSRSLAHRAHLIASSAASMHRYNIGAYLIASHLTKWTWLAPLLVPNVCTCPRVAWNNNRLHARMAGRRSIHRNSAPRPHPHSFAAYARHVALLRDARSVSLSHGTTSINKRTRDNRSRTVYLAIRFRRYPLRASPCCSGSGLVLSTGL